jgi:hypothetical protein
MMSRRPWSCRPTRSPTELTRWTAVRPSDTQQRIVGP